MPNILEQFEARNLAQMQKNIPDFKAGDTLIVQIEVKDGERKRLQAFEGLCIARRHRGINSSFIIRKISYGEGVERTLPLYSPIISSITVKSRGAVRRAKLYYIRALRGKAARIRELLPNRNKKNKVNAA